MIKIWRNNEGAAAIEFGLIAMFFFMVIFGIIEFGFLLYNNSMLTHASRVAARTGVGRGRSPKKERVYKLGSGRG